MDYRDNNYVCKRTSKAKGTERKVMRLTRKQQYKEDAKNIIVTGIALAVIFVMVLVMLSQLATRTTL
tara:strand:- start:336 stop:536 length:201 start_codon:yes stop_codon:yes gene_type:complete